MANYGISKKINGTLDEVKPRVLEALKSQGFGILTEIDVQKTFKQKIDVDFKPYQILGACNPRFAYRALSVDDEIGLLLPCNVVLKQEIANIATHGIGVVMAIAGVIPVMP